MAASPELKADHHSKVEFGMVADVLIQHEKEGIALRLNSYCPWEVCVGNLMVGGERIIVVWFSRE